MTQYHFLDESGDPGPHSNPYFALALVQLAARQPLAEIAAARQALHLLPTFEFKYHKTTPAQREVFFALCNRWPFACGPVWLKKAACRPSWLYPA